jgi:poly(3-hydroxybutyrate) depolymerase
MKVSRLTRTLEPCSSAFRRLLIAVGAAILSSATMAGEVIFDPGGPKDLPARQLAYRGYSARMRLMFDGPGILQSTSDLTSGAWESVTTVSPVIIEPATSGGNHFFRVLSVERPATIRVPSTYDPQVPTPLLIALHGYSSSPQEDFEVLLPFAEVAEARGMLLCYPEGTKESDGDRFWNATLACCNFFGSEVDDSGYLRDLIDDATQLLNVDPKRIYLVGGSNGGFMAYRMACEHADVIAGIVSIAGATFLDPANCKPPGPINVLQIHGTTDETVPYEGGPLYDGGPLIPGAHETIDQWAAFNGCAGKVVETELSLDLFGDAELDSSVTYFQLQVPGGTVELWTIEGRSSHAKEWSSQVPALTVDWLLAHPKP